MPPWLRELAHYEWAELAVDVMDGAAPPHDPVGDLLDGMPVLAPALMNLAYAWPVPRIGPAFRPEKPVATRLLVFRDAADDVNFIGINPVSAHLLALLQEGGRTGRETCLVVAAERATLADLAQGYAISDKSHGNFKLPLIFLGMLLPLMLSGAGRLSVDALIRRRFLPA